MNSEEGHNLNGLKVLWLEPEVQFKGKGIMTAWGEEMARQGWIIKKDPKEWEDCDLVFYGSDSVINQCVEAIGTKPTILYHWGWWPQRLVDPSYRKVVESYVKPISYLTRVLAPSPTTSDLLFTLGITNQGCLPGVDSRTLDDYSGNWFPEDNPTVLFVSRLVPSKDLETLIRAMGLLKGKAKLLVCGSGETKEYSKMCEDYGVQARFEEPNDSVKSLYLRNAAVLVHPSVYEGFGLPPLEALYCGTPVICRDIPQMRWLCKDFSLYFYGAEELAGLISWILDHPDESRDLVDYGARYIQSTLTLTHAAERLWAHFHQAIKEFLAAKLKEFPEEWESIYDEEHRRNWAYSIERFDPYWARHWRAGAIIESLNKVQAKKVLDVGCGAVYPIILVKAGFDVTAFDVSSECLHQVEILADKWGVKDNITLQQGYADRLPFDHEVFDGVIQAEIWEHVQDVEAIIDQAMKVLKPGGMLVVTTPIGMHHYDPMHLRVFDEEEMRKKIEYIERNYWVRADLRSITEEGQDPSCWLLEVTKEGRKLIGLR